MKNYIIPICALLMVGCGNRQVKQSTEKTITTVVNDTNAKPLAITSSSDSNQISDEDSIYLMAFEPLSSNLSSFSPEKKITQYSFNERLSRPIQWSIDTQ